MLLEKQSVLHYVSTDVEGYMRAKSKSQQSIEDIQKEILAIILWMKRDNGSNMAMSYNYGSSSPTVIDTRIFADLYCSGSEQSFPSKLQVCLPPCFGKGIRIYIHKGALLLLQRLHLHKS